MRLKIVDSPNSTRLVEVPPGTLLQTDILLVDGKETVEITWEGISEPIYAPKGQCYITNDDGQTVDKF